MKLILIIFGLVVSVFGARPEIQAVTFGISNKIRDILENLKEDLKCGFPEYNIPPMVPFEREYEEIHIKEDFITLFASVANLRIDGINDYTIGTCDFSALRLKFKLNLHFNKLHLSQGKYFLESLIAEELAGIEFHGDGNLDFALENINVNLDLQIGIGLKGLYMKKFNTIINVDKCRSNITGLVGGGIPNEIINLIIDRICVDTVKHHQNEISQQIYNLVVPKANEILKGITIKDILGWITGWWSSPHICTK